MYFVLIIILKISNFFSPIDWFKQEQPSSTVIDEETALLTPEQIKVKKQNKTNISLID